MTKILLTGILALGCAGLTYAQDGNVMSTTAPEKKEKKYEHYIGVQMNDLVRQVFNFNNSTTPTTIANPYLITYNINNIKSGWGLRLGAGYTYSSLKTDITSQSFDNHTTDMSLRLGIERRFELSHKWSTGVGIDAVFSTNNNSTTNITTSGDTITTTTKSTTNNFGGGAMGWLRYNITDRILIGTEASFYFTAGKETDEINITDINSVGGLPNTTSNSKTNNKVSNGTFSKPVVLYLIIKF